MGAVKGNNADGGEDVGQVMSLKAKVGFVFLIVVIVGGFILVKNK